MSLDLPADRVRLCKQIYRMTGSSSPAGVVQLCAPAASSTRRFEVASRTTLSRDQSLFITWSLINLPHSLIRHSSYPVTDSYAFNTWRNAFNVSYCKQNSSIKFPVGSGITRPDLGTSSQMNQYTCCKVGPFCMPKEAVTESSADKTPPSRIPSTKCKKRKPWTRLTAGPQRIYSRLSLISDHYRFHFSVSLQMTTHPDDTDRSRPQV